MGTPPHKRLCQIREGGMIGGVCLGIATFFNIDVTLVRIIFALFALVTGGWGILAYIGLMFILESIILAVFVVPIATVFYLFEVVIVVSIQAFIFSALSAIYIGSAIEPEH